MIFSLLLAAHFALAQSPQAARIWIKVKNQKFNKVQNFFNENFLDGQHRDDFELQIASIEIDSSDSVYVNLAKPLRPGRFTSSFSFNAVDDYNLNVSDDSLKLSIPFLNRIRANYPDLELLSLEATNRFTRLRLLNPTMSSQDDLIKEKYQSLGLQTKKPVFDILLPEDPTVATPFQLLRLQLFNLGFITDSTVASLPRPMTEREKAKLGKIPDGNEVFVARIGDSGLFYIITQIKQKIFITPTGPVVLSAPKPYFFKPMDHPNQSLTCFQLLVRAVQ